jgi:hypothetical protein
MAVEQFRIQGAVQAALAVQMAQRGIHQRAHRLERRGDGLQIGAGAAGNQGGNALFDSLVHGRSSAKVETAARCTCDTQRRNRGGAGGIRPAHPGRGVGGTAVRRRSAR